MSYPPTCFQWILIMSCGVCLFGQGHSEISGYPTQKKDDYDKDIISGV